MKRCPWCNLANPLYVKYHDEEWGRLNLDEHYLFEMLILESFQAGLSWECVLNKRENFRQAYDNFELHKICNYDETKIQSLLELNFVQFVFESHNKPYHHKNKYTYNA